MSDENQNQVAEETVDVVEQEETLDEGSAAAATLNVKATKSQMLNDLMGKVAGMSQQDLSSFLDKSLAQVGKEADGVPDNSGKNKQSVSNSGAGVPAPRVATAAKTAMKEDMDALLQGEELSEEVKVQVQTIFEAAVNNRVTLIEAEVVEHYESALEEELTNQVEALHEQVGKFADHAVQEWLDQNKVELENNYRVEATESFIEGFKDLFVEHYIDVPEEKVDMVAELTQYVDQLEESLESASAENIELVNQINDAAVDAAFDVVSEELVDTQIEKLRSLAEGIDYSDYDDYISKLTIIKEQYFTESKSNEGSTGLINEEVSIGSNDESDSENQVSVSEEMKHYFQAISSTSRK